MNRQTPVDQTALYERAARVFTPNYNRLPIVFERGEGPYLIDAQGKRYLDFAGGIAVNVLGHHHRAYTQAIVEQLHSEVHISNFFLSEPMVELAERLVQRSFADRVYFANSGAEANEAAIKIARRTMQVVRGDSSRYKIITMLNGFHGRTFGAMSATGQAKYQQGVGPLVPGFTYVPFNDLSAVENAIDNETCAVMLEPIQGEGGLLAATPEFMSGVRELCDKHHILMIVDEVQTGMGRTGKFFAFEHFNVTPDIATLAKGLGGGIPIAAMLCTEEVAQGFQPGVHGSTFAGGPLACRAGCAVLDAYDHDQILKNVVEVGDYLHAELSKLVGELGVTAVRGLGLLCGLGVDPQKVDRTKFKNEALQLGLTLTVCGKDAIRLTPPLIIGKAHVDRAVAVIREALALSQL